MRTVDVTNGAEETHRIMVRRTDNGDDDVTKNYRGVCDDVLPPFGLASVDWDSLLSTATGVGVAQFEHLRKAVSLFCF